jgi:hypothetical protein
MVYIRDKWRIKANRMRAVGYGFSRPKARNDPVKGNRLNRRVEVYIRGVDKAAAAKAAGEEIKGMGGKPIRVKDVKPEDK